MGLGTKLLEDWLLDACLVDNLASVMEEDDTDDRVADLCCTCTGGGGSGFSR